VTAQTEAYLGMPPFPAAARQELEDTQLRENLARATSTIRTKRLAAVGEVDNWQELRRHGALVKDHVLRNLDRYLEQFEAATTKAGATVHWASDGDEANRIIGRLTRDAGADEVVKVKSMATQETGLNEALAQHGIAAWETDLAELIVQLGDDVPSHFLVPAIHRNRREIRDIFVREMAKAGRPAPDGLTDDPARLAEAARLHLREKFLRAKVGVSGANFAIADTGTLVVVESEGNGRMCLTLPQTLITLVGIEKLLPSFADLGTFLQLLPRSSTAERMNPYTSMWTGSHTDDGPRDVHVVLLDNGRTNALADATGRQALRCIRCSACLNVCPVYERVGGHAYGSVYPGPIGAILNPLLHGVSDPHDAALPYASSLCGACYEVCPVAIDIPTVLIEQRERVVDAHPGQDAEHASMTLAAWVLGSPLRLKTAQRAMRAIRRPASRVTRLPGILGGWTMSRSLPALPKESFRAWWARTRGDRR
jgi:L-lactate dehydrogenase complex protein LldF